MSDSEDKNRALTGLLRAHEVSVTAMRLKCIEADLRNEFPFALVVEQNYIEHLATMVLEERLTQREAIIELQRAHGIRVNQIQLEQLKAENLAKLKLMEDIMALKTPPKFVVPTQPRSSAELIELTTNDVRHELGLAADIVDSEHFTFNVFHPNANASTPFVPLHPLPHMHFDVFDDVLPTEKASAEKIERDPPLACRGSKRVIRVQD